MEIVEMQLSEITPYKFNAKKHPKEQVEQIKKSIQEFGFNDPIAVWGEKNIIVEGHGRYLAANELGMENVPVIRLDNLTDEERKAYTLAHNKLTMNSDFDLEMLEVEMSSIQSLDMSDFGFMDISSDWFENHKKNDTSRQEGNEEYNEFLDKFDIPKTTDDCYTPQNIYDAVKKWVAEEYGLKQETFIRPFYPGGDYQKENYEGKIVVDNPPFSILAEIEQWYNERNIKYFLFAPSLTCIPSKRRCCAICTGNQITYENGAKVPTSFVTNLEECAARTAPSLYQAVEEKNKENTKGKEIPSYEYPPNVVTSAMLAYLSKYGVDYKISHKDSTEKIGMLEAQKELGKGIFGGGHLNF